jgi:hypothetical protein
LNANPQELHFIAFNVDAATIIARSRGIFASQGWMERPCGNK